MYDEYMLICGAEAADKTGEPTLAMKEMLTMKKIAVLCCAALLSAGAWAELQEVSVGGEVRVRGRHWNNTYTTTTIGMGGPRHTPGNLLGRPIGPLGLLSRFDFDDAGDDQSFIEQRTRLNVNAKFTEAVRAFIELESYDVWGTDFRSIDYITGVDGAGLDNVALHQAYIEANEMWGTGLRLRIGRQELKMGKGWLVDVIGAAIFGRSFDAARLTYTWDEFVLDAWASTLVERLTTEDAKFYGIYGTYSGWEPLSVSAYYMLIHDGVDLADTTGSGLLEWFEDRVGVDQYEDTFLNTVGLRLFGDAAGFDYDWELAYQFGDADLLGARFVPFVYGDNDATFDNFATDLEVGYTFDASWMPRIYLGGALFQGEDNRDFDLWHALFPNLTTPESSISFNRMFPGKPYSMILGIGQDLTNFWQLRGGIGVKPTEKVSLGLKVAYFEIDEPFEIPRYWAPLGVPVWAAGPWWTRTASEELGWTTALTAAYKYSDDLTFRLLWEHLFTGDGLEEGNFLARNGLEFVGGTDDQDADYVHFDVQLTF